MKFFWVGLHCNWLMQIRIVLLKHCRTTTIFVFNCSGTTVLVLVHCSGYWWFKKKLEGKCLNFCASITVLKFILEAAVLSRWLAWYNEDSWNTDSALNKTVFSKAHFSLQCPRLQPLLFWHIFQGRFEFLKLTFKPKPGCLLTFRFSSLINEVDADIVLSRDKQQEKWVKLLFCA